MNLRHAVSWEEKVNKNAAYCEAIAALNEPYFAALPRDRRVSRAACARLQNYLSSGFE